MNSFLKRFSHEEDGAVLVLIALMLFVLLGFAALAIDMSYAHATRTKLQVTASAAALAGAQQITDADGNGVDDTDDYRRGAVEYAYRNMAASTHGNIVQAACGAYDPGTGSVTGGSECSDIKVGNWDPDTRSFTAWDDGGFSPATMDLDAVRVRTHRSQDNGNPLNLFLAPAVGLAQLDINVAAIAWADEDNALNCYQRGIIAYGMVDMDSTNTFTDAICVYGEQGVKVQSNNCFQGSYEGCGVGTQDPGVQVMTPPPPNWDEQGGPNPGFDDAKQVGNQDEPLLAEHVGNFIDAVADGFPFASWNAPGFDYEAFVDPVIGNGTQNSLPATLEPYTIYDISGTADIPEGDWDHVAIKADIITTTGTTSMNHVILMAETEISIASDFTIDHAVLASRDLLKLGSNGTLGGAACDPNGISVAVYSIGKFTVQSDTTIRNTQLITGYDLEEFDLQSNNTYEGVTIQAMGNVNLGSNNSFSGCPPGTGEGPTGNISGLYVRLVD